MSTIVSTAELRAMQPADLRQEILRQRAQIAQVRMGIRLGKEKDTAKHRRARRQLARMETVLRELERSGAAAKKSSAALPAKKRSRRVSTPASVPLRGTTEGKPAT